MDDTSGPGDGDGNLYVEQHLRAGHVIAQGLTERTGVTLQHELVFCSRSGSPRTPWLEPDVNDRIEELAAEGVTTVVLAPIGFVSDHMEVVNDLDLEARETADRVGVRLVRVPTAGTHPLFVEALVDLLEERAARGTRRGRHPRPGRQRRPATLHLRPGLLPQPPAPRCRPSADGTDMSSTAPDLSLPDDALAAALEALAADVARSAGRLVVDERPDAVEVASTKSSATDVVTVMDQRSQDHLIARLREARPDDAVLGEESGGASGTSGITWVIDPIDGTVNYLYGIPAYAVSVAAVVGDPTDGRRVAPLRRRRLQPRHRRALPRSRGRRVTHRPPRRR